MDSALVTVIVAVPAFLYVRLTVLLFIVAVATVESLLLTLNVPHALLIANEPVVVGYVTLPVVGFKDIVQFALLTLQLKLPLKSL